MTAFPSYSTGTVAVANGATVVIGTGSIWSGVNARAGDEIVISGNTVTIVDVTDTTHLVIDPWPYANVAAGASYKVYQKSPLRFAGGQAMADVSTLVAALNTDGFYVFVSSTSAVPDPSYGNTGQYAFQASTGKLWQKSAGVWNFLGVYTGINFLGAWNGATAYGINQVVTLGGSSYICILSHTNFTPPNATYWSLLSSIGSVGPSSLKPIAPWVTATAYVVGPPSDYVLQSGSSYQCLVSHTAGVFATDLAALKWGLVAQAGVNAPTYGGASTTSFAIGVGSKAFATQAGLAYQNGSRVRASSNATTTNWMEGVASYSGTTLTIVVDKTNGSATAADWNFNIAGQPGAGDLSSANNLSDVSSKISAMDNLSTHGTDIASAATLNLDAATGNFIRITGSTTIAAITLTDGRQRTVYFTGSPLLTNGASLVLPGGANIQSQPGDIAVFVADGTTIRCSDYMPASSASSRALIYAAPFDALAYNGAQTNGSMEVSQELAGNAKAFAAGGSTSYVLDGWQINKTGTNAFNAQQVASVFPGYNNELKLTITTAQVTLSTDFIYLNHNIEGYRIQRAMWGTSSAVPIVIGFWVKSSVAGTLGVIAFNSGQSILVTGVGDNVIAASTPKFVTVTLPAQTTGAWNTTTGMGLQVVVQVSSGAYNIAATNGNTFEITGLIVLPGIELPSPARAPFIMRPFDQEILSGQRYWETTYDYGVVPGTASALTGMEATLAVNVSATIQFGGSPGRFKVAKRIIPTMTAYSPNTGASGKCRDNQNAVDVTPTMDFIGTKGMRWYASLSVVNAAAVMLLHWTADSRL